MINEYTLYIIYVCVCVCIYYLIICFNFVLDKNVYAKICFGYISCNKILHIFWYSENFKGY